MNCEICEACQGRGYIGLDWTPVVQRCDLCQVYISDIEAAKVAAKQHGIPWDCLQCDNCGYWEMIVGYVTSLPCGECGKANMIQTDFPKPYS